MLIQFIIITMMIFLVVSWAAIIIYVIVALVKYAFNLIVGGKEKKYFNT